MTKKFVSSCVIIVIAFGLMLVFSLILPDGIRVEAMEACPAQGTIRSPSSNKSTSIQFETDRNYGRKIDVYWIDFTGKWKFYRSLKPGEAYEQQTHTGHIWIGYDGANCAILTAQNHQIREVFAKDTPGNATPANTVSTCPDDGPRMPGSGICRGRASNYLNIVEGKPPMLMDGCTWEVNEAAMPGGDFLLYLASSCRGQITQLEFSGGARFAEVSVVRSAMSGGKPGGKIITVGSADKNDPHKNVLIYARHAMENKVEARKCRVRKVGDPADALVVDVSAKEAARAPQDGPRSACGPFGFDGENNSFWRVFDGNSWFFNLGQDAYQDIDPRSLTVVRASYLPK